MNRIFRTLAVTAIVAAISFAADAQSVIGQMTPFRTYPASGEEIPSFQGISEVDFIFPGGGDIGIESINRQGKTVTIARDGQNVATIDCTDRSAVLNPGNNPSELSVRFPAIKTPGVYTVTIPQNLVTMAIDYNVAGANENEDEENEDSLIARTSKQYTIEFTIVPCPEFTIDPAPGKVFPEQLKTVTITFPEGTEVIPGEFPTAYEAEEGDNEGADNGENDDPEAPAEQIFYLGLYDYNDASYETGTASTLITNYWPEFKGNKVILHATDADKIAPRRGNYYVNWDYINIPKEEWYMDLDGVQYVMPAFKFEKYNVQDPVLLEFEITPQNGLERDMAPAEFETVTIKYPESYSPTSSLKKGNSIGFLRQCGVTPEMAAATSGYVFGFYVLESIDTQAHTLTAKIKSIDPNNSYCNNLDAMESGYYSFYLNGGIFNTSFGTNEAIDFPGYYVKGMNTTTPNNYIPENLLYSPNIVDPQKGFSTVTVNWPFPMAVENNAAAATLLCDGKEVGSVAVASLEISHKGTRSMEFRFTNDIFLTPGTYTISIPAGTFRQTSYGAYQSGEVNYDIILPGELKFTPTPAGGEKMSTALPVEKFDTFKLSYDAITTVFVFDDIDLSSISLELLNTAGIKVLEFNPSAVSGEGNTVTLTFDPEIRLATGANNYVYRLSVPAGIWIVDRFGEGSFNTDARFFYRIVNPAEGSIDIENEYNIDLVEDVYDIPPYSGFTFTSPVQTIQDVHTFGSMAYLARETENGYEKVFDYLIAEKTDDYNVAFNSGQVITPGLATRAVETEKYRIVIPENSVMNYDYCGIYHPEYTFDFVIHHSTTGVADIIAEDEVCDVYSIDGILVLRNANKEAMNNLAHGLYIVNGKKFVK